MLSRRTPRLLSSARPASIYQGLLFSFPLVSDKGSHLYHVKQEMAHQLWIWRGLKLMMLFVPNLASCVWPQLVKTPRGGGLWFAVPTPGVRKKPCELPGPASEVPSPMPGPQQPAGVHRNLWSSSEQQLDMALGTAGSAEQVYPWEGVLLFQDRLTSKKVKLWNTGFLVRGVWNHVCN